MDGTLTIPVINFRLLREKLGILDKSIDILEHVENAPTMEEKQRRKQMVEDFEDEGDRLLKLQPNLHKLFYFLKEKNLKRALLTRNKQSAVDSFVKKFIQNDERNSFKDENEIFLNVSVRIHSTGLFDLAFAGFPLLVPGLGKQPFLLIFLPLSCFVFLLKITNHSLFSKSLCDSTTRHRFQISMFLTYFLITDIDKRF